MESILIGIDPGKSSGLAVIHQVEDVRAVVAKDTICEPNLAIQWVSSQYQRYKGIPTTIVLEMPARRKPGSDKVYPLFVRFEDLFKSWATEDPNLTVVVFGPGTWKPFIKANKWKRPKGYTQHEADALNMVRFYLFNEELKKRTITTPDAFKKIADNLLEEMQNAKRKAEDSDIR